MAASNLSPRLRLLRVLHGQPHRYTRIRWLTEGMTLVILYGIPLLGLARFDLWEGRHLAWRRPVGLVYGLGSLFVSILAFYTITFAFNALLGRVFCGFGCPIGQASRFGDDIEASAKSSRNERVKVHARAMAWAVLLAIAGTLWFVSPYVFIEGSPRAIATTLLGGAGLAAVIYLHGRFWRWNFCQSYCPIGIYYSVAQTAHGFGIHFDESKQTCKECDTCDLVCPVGLAPRDLTKRKVGLSGFGIDDLPGVNHCLTCGECVRQCERQFKKDPSLVPLRLSFNAPAREGPPHSMSASPRSTDS